MDLLSRVKYVMSTVLKISEDKITGDSSPYTISGWDSMKHVTLILAIEEEFDIKFEVDEIETMVNCKVIVSTIESYIEA